MTTLTSLSSALLGVIHLSEDEKKLFRAIDKGYANQVSRLLSQNHLNLEVKNYKSQTPLFRAIEKNKAEIVKILIAKGANIEAQDGIKRTPLSLSFFSSEGKFKIFKMLIKHGADVNYKNEITGISLVHLSVIRKRLWALKGLLSNGAICNSTEYREQRSSALHEAVTQYCSGNIPLLVFMKVLLCHNASYTALDNLKRSPLDLLNFSHDNFAAKNMFQEVINYNTAVSKQSVSSLANAITNNGKEDSAFNKTEWINLALLRNNSIQIIYCVKNNLLRAQPILQKIAQKKHLPLCCILFELMEQMNSQEKKDSLERVITLAKKNTNKNIVKRCNEYKMLQQFSRTQTILEESIPQ